MSKKMIPIDGMPNPLTMIGRTAEPQLEVRKPGPIAEELAELIAANLVEAADREHIRHETPSRIPRADRC
jgi:hypothetical protein